MHSVPRTLLVLAVTLAGCAPRAAERPPALPDETAEFVILRGDSIVATEHTARTGNRLDGEIVLVGETRAHYVATLDSLGGITALEATLRSWDGSDTERMSIELSGDGVTVRSSRWAGVPQRFAGPAATVYLHPSPAMLEIILQRAAAEADTPVSVRVWLANSNARTTARVTLSDEQPVLELAGTRVRIMQEDGVLLGGEVRALGWVFHRRPQD